MQRSFPTVIVVGPALEALGALEIGQDIGVGTTL